MISSTVPIILLFGLSSCGTPGNEVVHNDATHQEAAMKPDNDSTQQPADAPINQRFRTLDDYLAWLRMTQEPVDGSWYEEVQPGIYQLRTGNLRVLGPEGDATPAPQTFTRAELAKKFGFSE